MPVNATQRRISTKINNFFYKNKKNQINKQKTLRNNIFSYIFSQTNIKLSFFKICLKKQHKTNPAIFRLLLCAKSAEK